MLEFIVFSKSFLASGYEMLFFTLSFMISFSYSQTSHLLEYAGWSLPQFTHFIVPLQFSDLGPQYPSFPHFAHTGAAVHLSS